MNKSSFLKEAAAISIFLTAILSALSTFRPDFCTLKEWLENLRMHLEMGLALVSELEQLQKDFWKKHGNLHWKNGLHAQGAQSAGMSAADARGKKSGK